MLYWLFRVETFMRNQLNLQVIWFFLIKVLLNLPPFNPTGTWKQLYVTTDIPLDCLKHA